MTLKLGMRLKLIECDNICSNDDSELILAYFTARSNLVPFVFVRERFARNYWSLWGESLYIHVYSNKWVHDELWQPKVRVIHWPLSKVTDIKHFQTSFPQKPQGHLKPNFIWGLHGMSGWKFIQIFWVTWPKWLKSPYMVKTFQNLLRNQEADDFETWYTGSGTQVLPNLFKWGHWVDLDYFYDMVRFVS